MNYISPKEGALNVNRWPKDTMAAGRRHTIAIKYDGTVVAVGDNKKGQCNVNDWSNIVAVAAGNVHMATNTGNSHTIGLKSDGTVIAIGDNEYGQCDVSDWHDIKLSSNYNRNLRGKSLYSLSLMCLATWSL